MWDEIDYPFSNFNGCTYWKVIMHHGELVISKMYWIFLDMKCYISPSRVSYGVSFVSIWGKIDCIIIAPHCICFRTTFGTLSQMNWMQTIPLFVTIMNYHTPCTTKLLEVYWFHSILPSVHLSVRPSIYYASHVRSVVPTVLVGSISYLCILSSNFSRCVACNKVSHKILKLEIWQFF